MEISYDFAKNARNIAERGLDFARVGEIDFDAAKIWQDMRHIYPEARYIALCYLESRLHVLCFTETKKGVRVISLRKANQREANKHGLPITQN